MDSIEQTFAWFFDECGMAAKPHDQALAWLRTPNARVKASRIGYGDILAGDLLDTARRDFESIDLPHWEDPLEAEEWMEGRLEWLFDKRHRKPEAESS